MFYKVMGTFLFFLLWYAFFIVAFGLAFYIMLHKDDGSPVEPDDYIYFNRPWLGTFYLLYLRFQISIIIGHF